MAYGKRSNEERFMDKVSFEPNTGCWLWTASIKTRNRTLEYGAFCMATGDEHREVSAHRASYTLFRGTIPEGMCVCHKCDVSLCVNPDHLFLGTIADNNRDMYLKNRHSRKRTGNIVGAKHPRAKLTDAQVREIRALSVCGEKTAHIAKRYGVDFKTISRILKGIGWRHLLD
jgi:hypothetical protein